MIMGILSTWLPTKNETSETTVLSLFFVQFCTNLILYNKYYFSIVINKMECLASPRSVLLFVVL